MAGIDDTWTWRTLTPATPPEPRYAPAMAWGDSRVLLFGGADDSSGLSFPTTTWQLVGDEWAQLSPAAHPPARQLAQMVYDTVNSRFLLHGGLQGDGTRLNDLWEFTGGNWNQLSPTHTPPFNSSSGFTFASSMVWDGTRIILVVLDPAGGNSQTWQYASSDWTRIGSGSSADFFNSRIYMPLCYASDRVVACGGSLTTNQTENDTNTFSGTTWTNTIANGTVGMWLHRRQHGLIWDGFTAFMFAGTTATVGSIGFPCANDCYTYDKSAMAWTQRFPMGTTPSERMQFGMVFDGTRVIGYSGAGTSGAGAKGDTWVLEPPGSPAPTTPGVYLPVMTMPIR